nr:MAG TPA: major capsid protein [Caudoviricetes sp.]
MPAVIEFIGLYDQNVVKPKSFVRDNYFKKRKTSENQKMEIEFRKGRQLIAPFVSEFIPGTEMVKNTYESKYFQAPKVAPKRTFSAFELYFNKTAGETIYGGKSPEERKADLLAESFAEFEEQITRREEKMCTEALFNGKVVVKGEGIEGEIAFGTVENITPATLWTQANADIIGDIQGAITKIGENTGLRPEIILMDPVAAKLFVENEKIQKLLDIRNYHAGEINPREIAGGAIYIGTLAPFGLPIYSYQSKYSVLKADGKTYESKDLIPEGTVLLAPSNNTIIYGPAADVEQGIIVAERAVFTDKDSKSNTVEIRTESRPLPVVYDIEAIKILKVK